MSASKAKATGADARSPHKSGLSSTLLQMKFMKRKQEAELRESLEEKQQRIVDESHWVIAVAEEAHRESAVEEVPSYVNCEGLLVMGRRSFGAFNPEIENLQREEQQATTGRGELKEAVDSKQMASLYLQNTAGKRKHGVSASDAQPHTKKFLKPSRD